MQTNPLPEIDSADLKAAREFLTALRPEPREERAPRPHASSSKGFVPVSNGIARARMRSAAKSA